MSGGRGWLALSLLGPMVALAVIWLPVLAHYHVPEPVIDDEVLDNATTPIAEDAIRSLPRPRDGVPVRAPEGQAAATAERLMSSGRVGIGRFPPQPLAVPFDASDLERGSVSWRLQVAAMVAPRLFLDAYQETGDPAYLELAKASVLGWARFERRQWLPKGLLWNDHAVAARVRVLADFWRTAREDAGLLEPTEAREILAFAGRSLRLAAEPGHYNARTNHGIIQDLALWAGHLSFPGLPAAERAGDVAYQRFSRHLPYYLSREGVVLEHSAGYHRAGLSMIGQALRYMDLAGQPIPAEWWERYRAGVEFFGRLRRPDSSLPRIGDTHPTGPLRIAERTADGGVRLINPSLKAPGRGAHLYPVSGYAVSWRGSPEGAMGPGASQTVLAWSDFPWRSHKHADELSLHFWADGIDWWTGVGYWPYGHPARERAVGWTGANAPHYIGERAQSSRRVRLLAHATDGREVRFLDLRRAASDYTARRQVLTLPGGTWTVLDSARHARGKPTREVWRTGHGVRIEPRGDKAFRLTHPADRLGLHAWFGGEGRVTRVRGGEDAESLGMVVVDGRPVPISSLVLRRPSHGEPSVVVWRRSEGASAPRVTRWRGPADWRLRLPGDGGEWDIRRSGDQLQLVEPHGARLEVSLAGSTPVEAERARIEQAYTAMQSDYGRFRPLLPYRFKTTWLTAGLGLAHLAGLVVLPYLLGGRRLASLTVLTGWVAYALWLRFHYFPA